MTQFLTNLLTASFHGSIVILAVILLRLILKKAPKKVLLFAVATGRHPSFDAL